MEVFLFFSFFFYSWELSVNVSVCKRQCLKAGRGGREGGGDVYSCDVEE